jgi:tight adherence protein C
MLLLLGSLALSITVFLMTRLVLQFGVDRWQAEHTIRRADVLRPEAADWKRKLLAVAGHAFDRINRMPLMQNYRATLRRDNIAAGNPWDLDEKELLELSELLFVGATVATWIVLFVFYGSLNLIIGLVLGFICAFAPGYVIAHKSVRRRILINRALPFSMDLLVLTMEAGSSFQEAIEILTSSDPAGPMAQELTYFLLAVRHGKPRKNALAEMAERVRSDDLTPVVDAINTGEDLGTPVGRILRIQAEGIRAARSQRAEKLAAQASSKILFPTLLIMVAVLLMLMGPVIIKAVRGQMY